MAFVYWIKHKDHTDIKTEGYVGITVDFQKRIIKHLSVANTKSGDIVHKAIRKYKNSIEFLKICECTYEYAVYMEEKLRPNPLTGWNIVKGGNLGRHGLPQTENQKRLSSLANLGKEPNEKSLKLARESRKLKGVSSKERQHRSKVMFEKHLLDLVNVNLDILSRANEIYYEYLNGKKSYATATKLNLPKSGLRALFNRFGLGYNPLEDSRIQEYIQQYINDCGIYTEGKETGLKVTSNSNIFKGIFMNSRKNIVAYIDTNGKRQTKTFNSHRSSYSKALLSACEFLAEMYEKENRSEDLSSLKVFMKNNADNAA